MFDVGFSEMVVIAVVALIVIGPERLPKVARTLGHLFGRMQRYVNDVKSDISREMELDELRKLQKEVQGAAREFKTSVESAAQNVHEGVRSVEDQLNANTAEATAPAAPAPELPLAAPPDFALSAGDAAAAAPGAAPGGKAVEPRQPSLPGFDKI
jgi:sec-independent protein translocase protein TatB